MFYHCIVRARIDHRIKQLTEVLMQELQSSPERSIRGGPRAARRAVAQLIRLGKSPQVSLGVTRDVFGAPWEIVLVLPKPQIR